MLSPYWFKDGNVVSAPETEFDPVQELDETIEKFNFEEHTGKWHSKSSILQYEDGENT